MRFIKPAIRVVSILLLVLVLATGAAVLATQSAWFKNWLRGYIVHEANQYLNGQLTIGRLSGSLFYRIELEDVALSMDGHQVASAKDIGLNYDAFQLVTRGLNIDALRINEPVVHFARQGDGWSIGRLVKKERQEADRTGPARPLSIAAIGVSNGSLVFDDALVVPGLNVPRRIDRLDARLAFKYEPVRYSIEIAHVSFRGTEPSLALNDLSGGVAVQQDQLNLSKIAVRTAESSISIDGALQNYLTKPSFKMEVSSDKLSIPEIAAIVPAVAAFNVQPQFDVKLDGPLDRLGMDLNVRSSAGEVSGQFVADTLTPQQSVRGKVAVRHLNLAAFIDNPAAKSDFTGVVTADIRATSLADPSSLKGTIDVQSPRLVVSGYVAENLNAKTILDGRYVRLSGSTNAYGAAATVNGSVTLPNGRDTFGYDLNGHVGHVNLSSLPRSLNAPSAVTNVNGVYHASSAGPDGLRVQMRFEDSDIPGAHIAGQSTAEVSARRERNSWTVDGYQADLTVSRLDLQRVGETFTIPALALDRYKSNLDTHVHVSGRGTLIETMEASVNGELTNSSLFGGQVPSLAFDAMIGGNALHVKTNGTFAGVDPGAASGRPQLQGDMAGLFKADATITELSNGVTPDRIEGTANLTVLPSQIAGLQIDCASADAALSQQTLNVRMLDISGPDIKVQADGTVGLTSTGGSNLRVHAESTNLPALGKLIDKPLEGIGSVDATISGNRERLTASGKFTGNGVNFGGNGALTLSTDYKIDLPNLDLNDAAVTATTTGTFVTVAGQHINEVTAKTRYEHKQLDVDVVASQPQRSLSATGSLIFRPDDQELRLTKLDVTAQGLRWQLAPNTQTSVQYGGGLIAVKDAHLVSGNQEISANGTFGNSGEPLVVTLTNLDLSNVDTLLLRQAQFTGALNGTATVSGTSAAPDVKADFEVNQGGFRQFRYQSFKGTASYSGSGVTIDSRLDQNATNWVRVNGYAPTSLFRGATPDTPTSGDTAGERVNLHVESSAVDLGVVQGFTTALTNVTGTVQANIDVIGSGRSPEAKGTLTLANGAFSVGPTGVKYAHLNGHIELQNDRVHITDFTILDNANASLSLTGDIPIRQTPTANVELQITAKDFKVIDNKMGNVRVNSDLTVAGELRAPHVTGDLAVSTGTIKLDPIIAVTGESPYAIKPTEYTVVRTPGSGVPADAGASVDTAAAVDGSIAGASSPSSSKPTGPTGFDALGMDVRVTVPDDLVVQASDLRTPGALIGLGSLNATLGGDLRATKAPGQSPRLTGTVNTIRGTYEFQGRQFTILRDGRVRFEGTDEINPTLDVKTQRVIQGVQANVNVLGTMRRPRIELSSVPPLEQADILSLIVFNQPVNQLGEGQQISLGQRAQQMAVGAIAGELSKSLGGLLNVSEFDIQTSPESGAAAQLTVGQQVGKNLYVKVQQGVGEVSTTNFILEYGLTNWLRLQTNLLQTAAAQQLLFQVVQDSGFDLIFFFTF